MRESLSIRANPRQRTYVSRVGRRKHEVCVVVTRVGATARRAQYGACVAGGQGGAGAAETVCGAAVADQVDNVWIVWTCACKRCRILDQYDFA